MSFTIFYNKKTLVQTIKCLLRYSRTKRAFLGYKNKKFKKPKVDIFPNGINHGFGPKMDIFPNVFLGNIGQENVFYDILEQKKNPFQAIERRNYKSRKIDIFPKGLNHGFSPKMAIFPNSFFQAIQARKMSFTIFYNQNNSFLGYKNNKFKKSKN